jgi:hypothetical protein
MKRLALCIVLTAAWGGLASAEDKPAAGTFADDLAFLKKHGEVVVLSDKSGQAQVVVSPAMQGRVMTSTAGGEKGPSFGWINRELISSGKTIQHINPFGGEDRFWMGPEGGQFSIFFAKGVAFDLEHWFTPASMDTESWDLAAKSETKVELAKKIQLTNYSGTKLDVEVKRDVVLLSAEEAWKRLGVKPAEGVKLVAYESVNKVTNAGKEPWKKQTGLLSIWILGMFNASPETTVVIPIKQGDEKDLGKPVNSDYFGKVPPERLAVKDGVVYFRGDAKYRSKIGIAPRRCKPIMGSYDAAGKVLTLARFTLPEGATDYVNSMWKIQEDPYGGDVANSYNDGVPSPGAKPLGAFYELESSSPAAALEPGKSVEHVHRTIHVQGDEKALDAIAKATLGVGIDDIVKAIPKVKE